MTAHEIVVQHFGPKFEGKFLGLGHWPMAFERMLAAEWCGVHVGYDAAFGEYSDSEKLEGIVAEVGIDPHFIKLLDGYWIRAVTLKEIINQFPGPYDLLWIDVPEKNRVLWYTDQVQAAFRPADQTDRPFMCVIPEDGHNEAVETIVRHKGYRYIHREDGFFFMGNP